jgi:hypothetical protein
MERNTYEELDNFYFPSICYIMKSTELEHVKQTSHFGDISLHDKLITVDI